MAAPDTADGGKAADAAPDAGGPEATAIRASVLALREHAERIEPETTAMLVEIADDVGGRLAGDGARVQSVDALTLQFQQQLRAGHATRVEGVRVRDALQYVLVLSDLPSGAYVAGARKVLQEVVHHGHHIDRVYNYWPRGDSSIGVEVSFRSPDGLLWNLQIHTGPSYRAVKEAGSFYDRMADPDLTPEERRSIFEELVDRLDVVPVPKGALAQGAIYPRDRLVVRDEFGQIGSASADAEKDAWALRWRNGVWLESGDGAHRFHLGGRVLLDVGVVNEAPGLSLATFTGTASGAKFRQARVLAEGRLFRHLDFKVNYEFAGGDVGFADVYAALMDIGFIDALYLGHVKVPFSFEQSMSRKYLTFMERSIANALAPDIRETGIKSTGNLLSGRLRWQVGGFRDTDGSGDGFGTDNGYDVSVRITGLPIRAEGDRRLLHLGVSYVHQFRDGGGTTFSTRPESYLADVLLSTGSIAATQIDMVAGEIALVLGSLSVEAEYMHDFVRRSNEPRLQFHGGYVQVGYFLTGESRRYDRLDATFGRVVPNRSVRLGKSDWGAWQLAARFSAVTLDDQDISGGTELNGSVAINWFATPIVRISTEYVYGDVRDQGHVHVWQMRFQFEF